MISSLSDDIDLKQAELESAKDYINSLQAKYTKPAYSTFVDKSKPQCSKCHLRDGHNRRMCPNGDCPGPEYCNDLDKHACERQHLHEALHDLKQKEKELSALKNDKKNKETALSETRKSFKFRVESALINSNLDKYTFFTTRGRTPRQTVINNDIFILEKHYSGRVPMNMDSESKKFQKIISDFNTAHADNRDRKFKSINPEKELLVKHGIVYPPMHSGLPVPQWTTPPAASGSLYCDQSGNDTSLDVNSVPPKKRFRFQ